jgi:hypothetical protein
MTLSPMPNLPQQEARRRWVDDLLAIIAIQGKSFIGCAKKNRRCGTQVTRLKAQKGKPSISPSRLTHKDRKDNPWKRFRRGSSERRIDRTQVVKARDVAALSSAQPNR